MNIRPSSDLSYLLGVLKSDGWVDSRNSIGLSVKDREFAEAFANSLSHVLERHTPIFRVTMPLGPQWRAKKMSGEFARWYKSSSLNDIALLVSDHKADFLRGVYDSEGTLFVRRRGPSSVQPVYRLYNTDTELVGLCKYFLDCLDIHSRLNLERKAGERTVGKTIRLHDLYCLTWQGHKSSRTWEGAVGSSIARKRYVGAGPSPIRCPRKYLAPLKV